MFNVGAFNLTQLNLQFHDFILAAITMSGTGIISASARYEVTAKVGMNGLGLLELTISQGGEITMEGMGEMSAEALKELYGKLTAAGVGILTAEGTTYLVESLTFTGDFDANDVIEINSDNYTIKLNGANAMTMLTAGDFFNLKNGTNQITYTDSSGSRTVKLELRKRDRWL